MDEFSQLFIGFIIFVILLILVVIFFIYLFSDTKLSAQLDGSQEVPPVMTSGNGQFTGSLNVDGSSMSYNLTVGDLSSPPVSIPGSAPAHFHIGGTGVNGPIIRDIQLTDQGNGTYSSSGVWASTDSQQPLTPDIVNLLRTGQIYVNVHTVIHPMGEIRGQITE